MPLLLTTCSLPTNTKTVLVSKIAVWWPFVLWVVIVGVLSVIPTSSQSSWTFEQADKVIHGLFYFIATLLLGRSLLITKQLVSKINRFEIGAAGLLAYSWLIECIQGLLPYRSYEWMDLSANLVGIIMGYLSIHLYYKKNGY